MGEQALLGRPNLVSTENEFYSLYEWCLNPLLTLRELFLRLHEEFARHGSLRVGWQREESIINIYLFACAIGCTVDDFLAEPRWRLKALINYFPRWKPLLWRADLLVNLPFFAANEFRHRGIVLWRRRWRRGVEDVCALLAGESLPAPGEVDAVR